MEKKIVCIKELPDGEQHIESLEGAIKERIDWKVALLFKQSFGVTIAVRSEFTANIKEENVESMTLSYYIVGNKKKDNVECLGMVCNSFFCLDFEEEEKNGRVAFHAENVYDMALLTQALEFLSVGLCYQFRPVDINMSVEEVHRNVRQEELYYWKDYNEEEFECNYEETHFDIDEHHVAYSKDGKILMHSMAQFDEAEYRVPDGVEEIADNAFIWCLFPVHLLVPRSIKRIGCDIFGFHGGYIEMV